MAQMSMNESKILVLKIYWDKVLRATLVQASQKKDKGTRT